MQLVIHAFTCCHTLHAPIHPFIAFTSRGPLDGEDRDIHYVYSILQCWQVLLGTVLQHIEASVLCTNPLISWHSVFGLCNTALMCVAQQLGDPTVRLGILRVSSTRYRYSNKTYSWFFSICLLKTAHLVLLYGWPTMHKHSCDYTGSGYLTGCLGIMVGESGQVLGVEKHKELAERSMTSLSQAVPELMKTGTVKIMPGNVLGKVLKEYGPFDAIHVGAAAATMPQVRAATCIIKPCCACLTGTSYFAQRTAE